VLARAVREEEVALLGGDERFVGIDGDVLDFWRWALGDLTVNTARSVLAEFLVKMAVGDTSPSRVEWATYDVTAGNGTRIEVKGSGYLHQGRVQRPSFALGKVTGRVWNQEVGHYQGERTALKADTWVFALQTCTDWSSYDALDVTQWRFWVVHASSAGIQERARVERAGGKGGNVGLAWVEANASHGPIGWDELAAAIGTGRAQ
jgi:hypothetical protein